MAMGVNNYGIPGAYVPPSVNGQPAVGMSAAPPTYTTDMYNYNPGTYAPPAGTTGAQPQSAPNLMMVAGLAIAGFMLFGPVGAIVGGLLGLFMGKK